MMALTLAEELWTEHVFFKGLKLKMKGVRQHGMAELFHISVTVSAVDSTGSIICMEWGLYEGMISTFQICDKP